MARRRPAFSISLLRVTCPSWVLSCLPSWPFSSFSDSFVTAVPTRAAWFGVRGLAAPATCSSARYKVLREPESRKIGRSGAGTRFLSRRDGRIVALARADIQALTANTDLHSVIFLAAVVAARIVHERVQFLETVAFCRIVAVAAGIVRIRLQSRELPFEIPAAYADAVYRDIVAKQLLYRIAVGVDVGLAVVAVGDEEDDLAAVAAAVLQQLCRFKNRIVQGLAGPVGKNRRRTGSDRRAGAGGRLPVDGGPAGEHAPSSRRRRRGAAVVDSRPVQLGEELVLIAGKAFARMKVHIEAANEGFVAGAEPRYNSREARFHLPGVLRFQIVVQQDDRGEGERFRGKIFHPLLHLVVENAEIGACQVGNQAPGPVLYRDRQDHKVHVDTERALAVGRRHRVRPVVLRGRGGGRFPRRRRVHLGNRGRRRLLREHSGEARRQKQRNCRNRQ